MYLIPRKLYELRQNIIFTLVFKGESECKEFVYTTLSKVSVYEVIAHEDYILDIGYSLSRVTGISLNEYMKQIIETFRKKKVFLNRLERYIETL